MAAEKDRMAINGRFFYLVDQRARQLDSHLPFDRFPHLPYGLIRQSTHPILKGSSYTQKSFLMPTPRAQDTYMNNKRPSCFG